METKADHTFGGPRGRAVVCLSSGEAQVLTRHALEAAGFEVLAEVDRGIEILPAAAETDPDVIVLDISLAGTLGLRLLAVIKTLAPRAAIVVLSPFESIHGAVIEAGAEAVVPVDDPRRLRAVLDDLMSPHSLPDVGSRRRNAPSS